jgi:hypothetical protein
MSDGVISCFFGRRLAMDLDDRKSGVLVMAPCRSIAAMALCLSAITGVSLVFTLEDTAARRNQKAAVGLD